MNSGSCRTKKTLVALVAVAAIVSPLSTSAGAVGQPGRQGSHGERATYYLDVGDALPPLFRELSSSEATAAGLEAPEDTPTAFYQSDESGAYVAVHLSVGKGRSSRAIMSGLFDHPEQVYTNEDLFSFFADAGVPADQVSLTPGEWSTPNVGDRAGNRRLHDSRKANRRTSRCSSCWSDAGPTPR